MPVFNARSSYGSPVYAIRTAFGGGAGSSVSTPGGTVPERLSSVPVLAGELPV